MVGTRLVSQAGRFGRLWLLLPGWLVFMIYLPALGHGFVWDDVYFLVETPYLRHPDLWWQYIREPLFVSQNYFRPLPLASFVLEFQLGGSPFVFHLSNLLLHALNTSIVVLLARRASSDRKTLSGLIAGLFFGLHPALVENVCWISDRFDLFMASFVLSNLLFASEQRLSPRRMAGLASLFLAALLSKETAVVLIVLAPLWQWVCASADNPDGHSRSWHPPPVALPTIVMLTSIFLAYGLIRYLSFGYLLHVDSLLQRGTLLQHLLLIGKTFGGYVQLLIWPFDAVGPVHPVRTPIELPDVGAWIGTLALWATVAGFLWLGVRQRISVVMLCLVMAFVALGPVLNGLPLTIGDNLLHDRYLLLPLAFVAIALGAWGGRHLPSMDKWLITIPTAAWLVGATVSTTQSINYWQNEFSLWTHAYQQHPSSRVATENYLVALIGANELHAAIRVANEALGNDPIQRFNPLHNLAVAQARLNHLDEAKVNAQQALQYASGQDPKSRMDRVESLNLLGYINRRLGQLAQAEAALREAIELNPLLSRPHYNLAMLLYDRGEWADGDTSLALAVRYAAPHRVAALEDLARQHKQERMSRAASNW